MYRVRARVAAEDADIVLFSVSSIAGLKCLVEYASRMFIRGDEKFNFFRVRVYHLKCDAQVRKLQELKNIRSYLGFYHT